MPGKPINDQQVRAYMKSRNEGKTQVTSSLKSGISERSGRRVEKGELAVKRKQGRSWRTRKDPFEDVWESEIIPKLMKYPALMAQTLFEELQENHPGQYCNSGLRTFQRRVKEWKVLHGPDKEVMFAQEHPPGRMGLSDFTVLKGVEITVKGEILDHRLYHFRLAFSGWCDVKVIQGGESYTALAEGLQNALWKLGGAPQEHRTDSLSAAYRNLSKEDADDITERYRNLCSHYGICGTRNNPGKSHENGSVESPHGHLKHRIRQALLVRGSYDFDSVKDYQQWIDGIVRGINRRNRDRIEVERPYLKVLPMNRTTDYTEKAVTISTNSTFHDNRVIYSVPARLIGDRVRLHIFDDRIEAYVGTTLAVILDREHPPDHNHRVQKIDYRHLIGSLERKPQAFRHSKIRDGILPNDRYRVIWCWLDERLEPRAACKMIVGILSLAHRYDCEQVLEEYLINQKKRNQVPTLHELQERFGKKTGKIPVVRVANRSAGDYDGLLSGSHRKGGTS